jgi:hypothetical protein
VAPHVSWHSDDSFAAYTKRAVIGPGISREDKAPEAEVTFCNNFVKRHRTCVKFLTASWSGAEHHAEVYPSDGPRPKIFRPQSKIHWSLFYLTTLICRLPLIQGRACSRSNECDMLIQCTSTKENAKDSCQIRADLNQGMLAIIQCITFGLRVCYPKI